MSEQAVISPEQITELEERIIEKIATEVLPEWEETREKYVPTPESMIMACSYVKEYFDGVEDYQVDAARKNAIMQRCDEMMEHAVKVMHSFVPQPEPEPIPVKRTRKARDEKKEE